MLFEGIEVLPPPIFTQFRPLMPAPRGKIIKATSQSVEQLTLVGPFPQSLPGFMVLSLSAHREGEVLKNQSSDLPQ